MWAAKQRGLDISRDEAIDAQAAVCSNYEHGFDEIADYSDAMDQYFGG